MTSTDTKMRRFLAESGAENGTADGWQSVAESLIRESRWTEARQVIATAKRKMVSWDEIDTMADRINAAEIEGRALAFKTVRIPRSFGSCTVLGKFIKETEAGFSFLSPEIKGMRGGVIAPAKRKSARKTKKGKRSGQDKPHAHTVPCRDCADHPETRFPVDETGKQLACMHGRRYGDGWHCESCLSM